MRILWFSDYKAQKKNCATLWAHPGWRSTDLVGHTGAGSEKLTVFYVLNQVVVTLVCWFNASSLSYILRICYTFLYACTLNFSKCTKSSSLIAECLDSSWLPNFLINICWFYLIFTFWVLYEIFLREILRCSLVLNTHIFCTAAFLPTWSTSKPFFAVARITEDIAYLVSVQISLPWFLINAFKECHNM